MSSGMQASSERTSSTRSPGAPTGSAHLLRHVVRALILLVACAPAWAQGGAKGAKIDKGEKGDEAVLAAREAFRVGNAAQLARAAQAARGHVLEPYVEYWQLRQGIENRGPEELRDFLARREGSYLADRLRADWLSVLGRRSQWDLFREERPRLVVEDPAIACYGLLQRFNAGDISTLAELRPVWLTPRELPEACQPLADQLIRSGEYTAAHLWERFRLLAGNNQINAAKRLLGALSPREQPAAGSVDRIVAAPAQYLLRIAEVSRTRPAREMVLFALERLARADPPAAAARWDETLRAAFSAEDQAYGWGVIGHWGARRHLPEAVDWYARSNGASLTDEQLAWRARIAMRVGAWPEVRAAIEKMSDTARRENTWIYWRGRALREAGLVAEANAEFQRIAGEFSFYGQYAAEELGLAFKLPTQAAPPTSEEMSRAVGTPGLQRAMALFRLDMRTEAVREWNWALRGMDDRQLIAAAELAKRNEIWDRAINTADRTVAQHDFGLRFLAPYQQALTGQARAHQLEEHWVLGLVRQESRFIANAKSSAGAAGLMQLMPATARWVANKMGMKDFHWSRVTAVDVNAALGNYYLRTVLNELDGHPVLASAAYNAGPGRARRWQDAKPLEGAIYAESIPFDETRDYVKKVMSNAWYYAAVLGGKQISLRERMGVVGARGSTRSNEIP
jgi:soluble lytic murein transglycosylase